MDQQLLGGLAADFMDHLRDIYGEDAFVRDVVIVADVDCGHGAVNIHLAGSDPRHYVQRALLLEACAALDVSDVPELEDELPPTEED